MSNDIKTQVVVLGAGPGGYSAAFRAADLGLDVVLVESRAHVRWCLFKRRLYSIKSVASRS